GFDRGGRVHHDQPARRLHLWSPRPAYPARKWVLTCTFVAGGHHLSPVEGQQTPKGEWARAWKIRRFTELTRRAGRAGVTGIGCDSGVPRVGIPAAQAPTAVRG